MTTDDPTRLDYARCASELARRVEALCRERPEAMDVDTPFGLFAFGLKCDDLDPSLAQAGAALTQARRTLGWKRKASTQP